MTPFLDAVRDGDTPRVSELLAQDPTLANVRDEAGCSGLVLAFLHGHEETAAAIRPYVAELDIAEAIFLEDWERFEALSAAHPELLHKAHAVGGTPLYAAALVGTTGNWRIRSAGCEHDAAPVDGNGFTPARGALEAAHPEWALVSLTDLCSNGSDVNAPQRGGSSVLHGAVQRRDARLVRVALRKGAAVDALDAEGRTPLSLARALGWQAGAELLENHALVPRDNRGSRLALDANREPVRIPNLADVPQELQSKVTSSSHRNLDEVRELVAQDERLIFSVSTDAELAIEACAHTGARSIIRFHLDHGAPLSLPTAVSLGDLEAVEFWLRRDPTLIHERGAHDFPLMWYAVFGGASIEMAELLHHHGAPLDQESMGATALHACAQRGAYDLARWMLEGGATPDALGYRGTREGQTPRDIALAAGDDRMARLLEEHGG